MDDNDRDRHRRAVGFAGQQVEELIHVLLVAHDKAREAMGIIANAVGAAPGSIAGLEAASDIVVVMDVIDEQIGLCHSIIEKLNAYGQGF